MLAEIIVQCSLVTMIVHCVNDGLDAKLNNKKWTMLFNFGAIVGFVITMVDVHHIFAGVR